MSVNSIKLDMFIPTRPAEEPLCRPSNFPPVRPNFPAPHIMVLPLTEGDLFDQSPIYT